VVVLAGPILTYALASAAGAMILVVAEEFIPTQNEAAPTSQPPPLRSALAVMVTLHGDPSWLPSTLLSDRSLART
jgi:zinc transporter ZupT